MTAMSRNKGAAGERELFRILSYELGVAVRRKLGAARDGGCDGMDVPGWAVEVKRTEVLTLPLFWAQAGGRLSSLAAAGFVLAQVSGEAGWYSDPHDLAPEIFSLGRSAVDAAASVVRAGAGWAENKPTIGDMESARKYELHPLLPYFRACQRQNSDALAGRHRRERCDPVIVHHGTDYRRRETAAAARVFCRRQRYGSIRRRQHRVVRAFGQPCTVATCRQHSRQQSCLLQRAGLRESAVVDAERRQQALGQMDCSPRQNHSRTGGSIGATQHDAATGRTRWQGRSRTGQTESCAWIGGSFATGSGRKGGRQEKNQRKPVMVSEERAAEFTENAELREQNREIARDQEAIEDNSQMAAIFEADDRLAAAMAEIKLALAEVASQRVLAGAIGTRNEGHQDGEVLQRSAKRWLRDDVQPFPRCAAVRDGDIPTPGHFRKRRTRR